MGDVQKLTQRPRLRSALNFGVTWVSFFIRLIGQIGYFLIVARALGPHDYGIVASVTALLMVAGAFAGWGSDHILIRHVTVAPDRFGPYFGNALIQTAATAVPLGLIVYAAQSVTVGMPAAIFAAFAIGELFFVRLHVVVVCGFMAFERGGDLLVVNAGLSLARLAASGAAIMFASPLDMAVWAEWYLAGAMLTGLPAVAYAVWRLGRPRWYFARQELALGFHFCLHFVADCALRDLDKPMVAYFAGPSAAGIYNAAFRIIDAMGNPLRAFLASFYARFFKHGHVGIDRSFRFALKVLPLMLGYALFAGVALTFGADYLPLILGQNFAAAVPVALGLAFVPVFHSLAAIGGDILTSAGRQRSRALVLAALSLLPVIVCAILVPRFGAVGAAYGALGNAVILATTIWVMVAIAMRQARAAAPATPAAAETKPPEYRLAA